MSIPSSRWSSARMAASMPPSATAATAWSARPIPQSRWPPRRRSP